MAEPGVNTWDPTSIGGAFPAGTFYNPAANDSTGGNVNYNLGTKSPIGGATLGCNRQGALPLVFGVEGEAGYLKLGGSTTIPYSFATGSDTISFTNIGDWYAVLA